MSNRAIQAGSGKITRGHVTEMSPTTNFPLLFSIPPTNITAVTFTITVLSATKLEKEGSASLQVIWWRRTRSPAGTYYGEPGPVQNPLHRHPASYETKMVLAKARVFTGRTQHPHWRQDTDLDWKEMWDMNKPNNHFTKVAVNFGIELEKHRPWFNFPLIGTRRFLLLKRNNETMWAIPKWVGLCGEGSVCQVSMLGVTAPPTCLHGSKI